MKGFLNLNSVVFSLVLPVLMAVSLLLMNGCGKAEQESPDTFLIKTSLIEISSLDFAEELDLKKAAYPYDIKENADEYNKVVIQLVKTLSEELVLLTAAADKQIVVTDQELSLTETEFKKDYPDDSFEQILLENAISYHLWRERFKKNMIMEKLIDQELTQKITITPEDVVEFYNSHNNQTAQNREDSRDVLNNIKNETELVTRLRMQKTQENYYPWIQELYKLYPVEINQDKLKTFLIDIKKLQGRENAKKD